MRKRCTRHRPLYRRNTSAWTPCLTTSQTHVLQKSCGNEVIRHCLTLGINVKTKEHEPHNMIKPCWQIVERLNVAILARIERLLASAPFLDCCLKVVLIVFFLFKHKTAYDMLPPLCGQINRI